MIFEVLKSIFEVEFEFFGWVWLEMKKSSEMV
jgi:hypothetical protein